MLQARGLDPKYLTTSGAASMAQAFIRILPVFIAALLAIHKIALAADQTILEQAKKEGQLVFYSGIFECALRAI
jgi:hypothetical protein